MVSRESSWITDKLNALEPEWTPDTARAHVLLQERLQPPRAGRWAMAASIAAAGFVLVAALPQTRAFAQELWARWTVSRLAVVPTTLPGQWHISLNGDMQTVSNVREAEALTGYAPELPATAVGAPSSLTVLPSVHLSQQIDVAALRESLRRGGVTDVQVPESWNALELRAEVGPMVIAEYADGAAVTQAKSVALYVPVGVPLTDLANVAFRSAGLPAAEARAMALAYAIQPAWLLDVAPSERVRIEQVSLANGPATVVEALDETTPANERFVLLRNSPARLFLVTGQTRERVMTLAQAIE